MKKIILQYAAVLGILTIAAYVLADGPQPSVGLYWFDSKDPTSAPGMTAPLNQLLIRTDLPSLYYKSGAASTAWTKIGSVSSGGTVTSITCGTGLSCAPNPIVTAGTASLANTAVSPGSYTNANITVDAQGRLTAAASGSSGISGTGTAPDLTAWTGASSIGNFAGSSPAACAAGQAVTQSVLSAAGALSYSCAAFAPASSISGTTNTVAKFTSSTAIGNSSATDDGTTYSILGRFNVDETFGHIGILQSASASAVIATTNIDSTGGPDTQKDISYSADQSGAKFTVYRGRSNGATATTIAAGSNGAVLPQANISVASTVGFAASGTIIVTTSIGQQIVAYTGTSGGNTFTGCTGGTGTMSTGGAVTNVAAIGNTDHIEDLRAEGLDPNFAFQLATTITALVDGTVSAGIVPGRLSLQTANASGVMTEGLRVDSAQKTTAFGAFQSNGTTTLADASHDTSTGRDLTVGRDLSVTRNASVTGTSLLTGAVTHGGPYVETPCNAGQLALNTRQDNWNPACLATNALITVIGSDNAGTRMTGLDSLDNGPSTTIAIGSNGAALPQATINVASTSGFPTSGTISLIIQSSAGQETINCTGTAGGNQFTTCTGGTGTLSTGGTVQGGLPLGTVKRICNLGGTADDSTIALNNDNTNSAVGNRIVTVGVGRIGTCTTGGASCAVDVDCGGNGPCVAVNVDTYIGPDECRTLRYLTISPVSNPITAWFVEGAQRFSQLVSQELQIYPYLTPTALTSTSAATTIAAGSNTQVLPQATIFVASTTGFTDGSSGSFSISVTTSGGAQTVKCTGISGGNSFTGCSGGTGTMSTGGAVSFLVTHDWNPTGGQPYTCSPGSFPCGEAGDNYLSQSNTLIYAQTSTSTNATIDGLYYAGGVQGEVGPIRIIYNAGAGTLTIKSNCGSGASSPQNTFCFETNDPKHDVVLNPSESLTVYHVRDTGSWNPLVKQDYFFSARDVTMSQGLLVSGHNPNGHFNDAVVDIEEVNTGITLANTINSYSNNSGSYATAGGAATAFGVYSTVTATRASGANALTNIALEANASGAQTNYALITQLGNVYLGQGAGAGTFYDNHAYFDENQGSKLEGIGAGGLETALQLCGGDFNGTALAQLASCVAPTANHGTLSGDSTNFQGEITTVGSNTSVTLTFGGGGFGTTAHCHLTVEGSTTVGIEVSTVSKTAPVFSCFTLATGAGANCPNFVYQCWGH